MSEAVRKDYDHSAEIDAAIGGSTWVMRTLAQRFGEEGVRLVAWFD